MTETKADKATLSQLDSLVTTLLGTDLRGSDIAETISNMDNRVASLETSDVPRKVVELESDVTFLKTAMPQKVQNSVFGAMADEVDKLKTEMPLKAPLSQVNTLQNFTENAL